MTNLAPTIEPKSDQLNADDLIGGPRTVKITKVAAAGGEQPISISFEDDNGRPYKPCKSMRRVLVFAWGEKGADYVGRSMTLYRDDSVRFGGIEVGGIRISHMSHIERELSFPLTMSKAKRATYTVKPLKDQPKSKPQNSMGGGDSKPASSDNGDAGKLTLIGKDGKEFKFAPDKWRDVLVDVFEKKPFDQAKECWDNNSELIEAASFTHAEHANHVQVAWLKRKRDQETA